MGSMSPKRRSPMQPAPGPLALPTPCAPQVGAGKCVWADGFAMETVANHYRLLCAARAVARFRPAQNPTRRSVVATPPLPPAAPHPTPRTPRLTSFLVVDERFSGAQKFTRISPSSAGPSQV